MENKLIKDAIYRHFKGNLYLVEDICIHSETQEEYVLYRALYGDCRRYIRPKDMFLSTLDEEKKAIYQQTYRFELVTVPSKVVKE